MILVERKITVDGNTDHARYARYDSTGWPTQAPRTVSPTHHELSPSSLCHFIFSAKRLVARKEANPPISTGNRRETRLAVNNQGERRWEVSLISRLSSVSALAWMRGLLGCRERDSYSIARNKTCPLLQSAHVSPEQE